LHLKTALAGVVADLRSNGGIADLSAALIYGLPM
jgi:hypothetical protein